MSKLLRLLAALFALTVFSAAQADDVGQAATSVVRIIGVVETPGGLQISTGTGWAITPTRIVTNAHVVRNVEYATGPNGILIVPSNTRNKVKARIVAYDSDKDLAVLEVAGARFTPLKIFGGTFRPGSDVIALGYPKNVDDLTDASVVDPQEANRSTGNFSNNTKSYGMDGMIHTAGIARGNSGGPLVDQCGRVVGVNTLVTSNDRGDASFGFAISVAEIRAFLKRNGQSATVADSECVPPEVAEARRVAANAKADVAKAKADMEARSAEDARRQQGLAAIQEQRDNHMALAALLLVMAALAGAYGLIAGSKQDPENPKPWKARIGWGGAALLVLAAAGIFMTRPSLADPLSAAPAPDISGSDAAEPAAEATAAAAPARPAGRKIACTIDEGRSEYFATEPVPVELTIDGEGCVNGRTQYAASGDAWQRVSVPKSESAVARLTFDPKDMTYTHERWLPDDDTLASARSAKDKLPGQTCGMGAGERKKLAEAQRNIVTGMSNAPDEKLVYRCKAG